MNINLPTVFSQLNNTSSLWLFGVKDAADVTGRVGMAYHEGYKGRTQESIESGKHEARERFIDEVGGTIAWLGGVPLFRCIYNKTVFNWLKLDPQIHLKKILLKEGKVQAFTRNDFDKFNNNLLKSANKYSNTHIGKVLFSTVIPCLTIAFALPKLNKWLTSAITGKEQEQKVLTARKLNAVKLSKNAEVTFSAFNSKSGNKDQIKFKGRFFDIPGKIIKAAQDSQLSPVNSMLAIDLGISSGRVFSYDRKPQERYETAFKEAGIIFFFFVAGDYIKKGIEGLVSNKNLKDIFTNEKIKNIVPKIKLPNMPIYLDPKVIEDTAFKDIVKNSKINGNKCSHLDEFAKNMVDEKQLINFINNNIDNKTGKFNNYVLEAAKNSGLIKIEKDNKGNLVVNSKKYIETEQVKTVFEHIKGYINAAPTENLENFFKKTRNTQRAGIILNIAICNIFLGYILPKMQYLFREKKTGSNIFPAVQDHLAAKSLYN